MTFKVSIPFEFFRHKIFTNHTWSLFVASLQFWLTSERRAKSLKLKYLSIFSNNSGGKHLVASMVDDYMYLLSGLCLYNNES